MFAEIGLGEDEAEVYLICLKLGPATVLQISKKTNILRATLYKIFSRLESKNLVSQIEKDGRTFFVAEDPKLLLEKIKEEEIKKKKALEIISNLLPDLTAIATRKDHPKVRLFEGQKAISELWMMPLYTQGVKEILSLIDFDSLCSLLPVEDVLKFRDMRISKNIKFRVMRKKEIKTAYVPEYDERELREKRFVPKNFELSAGFTIFSNKVTIIITPGEPFGILIESHYFADTMRMIFERLWENCEKSV